MDIPAPAYTVIGAISAATIAGTISFVVTVLAKDQKTSEFRQAWIEGLRNDIAEFISVIVFLTDLHRVMTREGKTKAEIIESLTQKHESWCKLEMVLARIQLRINPEEHIRLLDALSKLQEYVGSADVLDGKVSTVLVNKLIEESQAVLKCEWRRVKRGELSFTATKFISLLVVVVAAFLGVQYALGNFYVEILP